jgi:excisionase family DNA binding protein
LTEAQAFPFAGSDCAPVRSFGSSLTQPSYRTRILRGELPAYKLGKEWRIRRDDFDQAMAARRTTTEPARTGGLWDPGDPG